MQTIPWQPNEIDNQLIDIALAEDLTTSNTDVTTDTLFTKLAKKNQSAQIISKHKEAIVISGTPIVSTILTKLGAEFEIITKYKDGDILKPNEILMTIQSDAASLLKAERITLNFLRHLCAIATLTQKFVALTKGTNTKILDTRKTTPGMRHLEKYAVACGGGVNHRMGLYDAFMLKDTHVDLIGGMKQAINTLEQNNSSSLPIIVEVRNIDELQTVITHGKNIVTRVLLDNMTNTQLTECVKICKGVFETEASGNINLTTINNIAKTGVDFASIGSLTYAAGHVDLSMKIIG